MILECLAGEPNSFGAQLSERNIRRGEGVFSLARPFLAAGVPTVVASLWDVDDRSTAELMDRLYDRLAAGVRPSQALRESKRSMIAKGGAYAKPYYWGPFQLFTVVP